MVLNAVLLSLLQLKIVKAIVYLYNYIFNAIIFSNINNNTINSNNLILNNTGIDYFSLVSHREYLYFRVYRYRVYIYIP